ncbi:hypothetical protein HC891_00775 [Candidatus Gracilibacteria bacterium]|nr:hypothetical protein [Candidatus Gracilibacteria bacterium]
MPFVPPVIPICYTRTVDGNNTANIKDQLVLDILPATIATFAAKVEDGNGGWKLNWDSRFTTIADADNDGLRSSSVGGLDPDDATWDADGDGLSDAYELDRRTDGLSISPVNWDTDGDGLSDKQEAEFGTHPVRADSDNDGLLDNVELYHEVYAFNGTTRRAEPTGTWAGGWDVVITGSQPYTLRVSGDATQADADGDGVTDQAERQFALATNAADRSNRLGLPYHPRIANENPIAIYTVASDPDLLVRPGQSVAYTTTVVSSASLLTGAALKSAALPALCPACCAPTRSTSPPQTQSPTRPTGRSRQTRAAKTPSGIAWSRRASSAQLARTSSGARPPSPIRGRLAARPCAGPMWRRQAPTARTAMGSLGTPTPTRISP